jgi:hypothetical protein
VEAVPNDVWKSVFEYHSFRKIEESQQQLQILSCVSLNWSNVVHELVRTHYKGVPFFSEWLLNHFEDITSLDTTTSTNLFSDQVLMKFTNLVSLSIKKRRSCIDSVSSAKLSKLTSLTEFDFNSHPAVDDVLIEKLTRLEWLNLNTIRT